ncbi:F-box protein At5g49610 [Amborella trichopoda]|uniref:F-box domain-containing protein n=1 Tax=Amborella trichopoda TaxID=13333 RepID=W1P663_AMBTC|nr:F-box protein At5g49610 [Amborella trichopoda]ERN05357.1 hypothetical protein AMTR_s00007p00196880 [Amborella trichopoda]|eukprot:XP_006843682.1 F-box protein At5g49610 [Amborella trichopoda]
MVKPKSTKVEVKCREGTLEHEVPSQQQSKSYLWDEELMVQFLSTLPESIVFQILLVLPVESICRFRCTCKSWRELFCSLEFARIHYLSPTPPSEPFALISVSFGFLFLCPSKNFSEKYSRECLPLVNLPSRGILTQNSVCSHGMVCYTTTRDRDIVIVCNPITKKYTVIPKFHSIFLRIKAFYFDHMKRTFKVLVWSENNYWIFSSLTRCWKKVVGSLPDSINKERLLHVHGMCYGVFSNEDEKMLFAWNIEQEEEKWEVIPLPSRVTTQVLRSNCSLVEWEGCVCLVHTHEGHDLGIWKLSKEKKWEEVMEVHIYETFVLGGYDFKSPPHRATLDVVPYNRSLFIADVQSWNVELHLYDISGKRKLSREFHWLAAPSEGGFPRISPFKPTLFDCNYLG